MAHFNSKSTSVSKSILSQFATYRNAITRIFFLTTILVISFLASLPEVSKAQCPDSTFPGPNPDSIGWIQGTSYGPIAGTSCFVWDTFCYRYFGTPDTTQVWLESVTVDSGTDCDSTLTDSEIIYAGDSMAFANASGPGNPHNVPCIKGFQPIVVAVYVAGCWWKQNSNNYIKPKSKDNPLSGGSGGTTTTYSPCSPYAYWCEKGCSVCYTGLIPTYSHCFVIQSDSSPSCLLPPPERWANGICYTLGCPVTPPPFIEPAKVGSSSTIDSSLLAYPNPVSGQLMVTSSMAGAHFLILDVLGREVMRGIIPPNGPLTLDVSSLPAGTYYVSEGQTEVKFVKN